MAALAFSLVDDSTRFVEPSDILSVAPAHKHPLLGYMCLLTLQDRTQLVVQGSWAYQQPRIAAAQAA